jgi:predicted ATPase
MATLETLKLSGWKSIKEAEIEFRPMNVLVGANGAGKSNLVSYFRLLNELAANRLQQHVAQSGGANALFHYGVKTTSRVDSRLQFQAGVGEANYRFELKSGTPTDSIVLAEHADYPLSANDISKGLSGKWGMLSGQESKLVHPNRRQTDTDQEIASWLGACRVYHFHDTTNSAAIRRAGYIDDNRQLQADGGNVAAMLYLYHQTRPPIYRRILGTIKQIAPFLDDFVLGPRKLNPKEVQLDWLTVGSQYLLGPHQLSDGTLRMIALATLLLQPVDDLPPLIVLDEPELGLHPAAIGILAGLLKQAAVHVQVLVATQSATLLNHFDAEDVIVVDSKDGVSTFHRLDPEPYREWIAEFGLSDLWERNVIGGGPYR